MFALACNSALAWTATPFSSSQPQQLRLMSRRVPLAASPRMDGAPSLRDQMKAYLKSVEERGVELTAEQKQMLAEFQDDDELLDQTGRADFMKGAEVLSAEEFQAQQQQAAASAAPAAAAAPPPPAPMPAAAPSPAPLAMGAVATATAAPPAAPAPVAAPAPAPAPVAAPVVAAPVPVPVAAAAVPVPPVVDSPIDATTARLWMMQAGELDTACGLLQGYADGSLDANGARELRKVLSSLICTLAAAA
jgi:hypothetical protein